LRKYLRPEFLNRIDEIIVFHALDRNQIRGIVGLQLERVKRTAAGQGITLEFEDTLIDHLAEVGYQPEYGARELRRQIRSQLESKLAGAMLRGEINEGDTVRFSYDKTAGTVRWEKTKAAAPAAKPAHAEKPAATAKPKEKAEQDEAKRGGRRPEPPNGRAHPRR
jgi:ATP-dependent Clp protease ATP-binding subunit ClpC